MTIDWWTLGIQTVNVIILVWLLGRFFWRPVAAIIAQRRATAQQMLAEAEAKRGQATGALADIERTRSGFAKEREAIIATAHQAAEQARTEVLAVAAKEAASIEASAKTAIEKERDAVEAAWAERANLLAIEIAKRLVARLDSAAIGDAFLGWLLREIERLPETVRDAVAADGVVLEAVSAAPLKRADEERYRKSIDEAFGARPQIDFKVDPALIAGLELRGPHLLIANSWRADLTRILADLTHDKHS